MQAAEGKFNPKVHVEYDWNLRMEEMDESDDDLDDKVGYFTLHVTYNTNTNNFQLSNYFPV